MTCGGRPIVAIERDFWYRWQAAEWMSEAEVPQLDGYGSDAFVEHCRRVDRQVRLAGDERRIARLLQAAARRLNALDWGDSLVRTGDFMVFAWEVHGESLEQDLAASRPVAGEAST